MGQMGDDEHHLPPHSVQDLRDAAKYLAKAAKLLRKVIAVEASPTADEPTIVTAPTRPSVVISLFDYTCLSLAPWKARGFEVHAYDRRHPDGYTVTASGVHIHGIDLSTAEALQSVVEEHAGRKVAFAMAYPPCTELSRAGARYWKEKGEADPHFQDNAAALVTRVDAALQQLRCPYYIENPASSTLRPPRRRNPSAPRAASVPRPLSPARHRAEASRGKTPIGWRVSILSCPPAAAAAAAVAAAAALNYLLP